MTGEAAGPVPAAAGDGSGAVLTPAVSAAEPPSPAPRAQPGKLPAPGAFPWKGIRGKRVAARLVAAVEAHRHGTSLAGRGGSFHRITEWFGLERTLRMISFHLLPWMALDTSRDWGSHSFSARPVPGPHHPDRKDLPNI